MLLSAARLGLFLWWTLQFPSSHLLPRGELIERLHCLNFPQQSYALYLPRAYGSDGSWPVLYVLDPAARGLLAARLFQDVAEESGFVLAVSHTSRNGPWEIVVEAINAMWDDTHQRLAVDDSRVYLAGFSGGARAAVRLAQETGRIAGVLACGAGFPGGLPSGRVEFDLVTIAGDQDMNYLELRQLAEWMEGRRLPHRLLLFSGGHDWPAPSLLRSALQWLRIRAAARGLLSAGPLQWREWFQGELEQAARLEEEGQLVEARDHYARMLHDFPQEEYRSLLQERLERLTSERRWKKAARERKRRERREAQWQDLIRRGLFEVEEGKDRPPSWWEKRLRPLLALSRGEGELMKRRVLDLLWRSAFERSIFTAEPEARALPYLQIALWANPENPFLYYRLARLWAERGKGEEALASLRRAHSLGMANLPRLLETDPAFRSLRDTYPFREFLGALSPAQKR